MNIKKRLQKVLDYVQELESENTFLNSKVAEKDGYEKWYKHGLPEQKENA